MPRPPRALIVPLQADDELIADVRRADSSSALLHLWWLGQSGFLVAHAGRHLLLDPYLSDALTHKYAGTATPHVRMTERVVAPERLGFVDGVTGSHHHTDHLDAETLAAVMAAAPQARLIVPEAHRALAAERAGVADARVVGLDDGVVAEVAGYRIEGVPAAHESIERDERGRMRFLGFRVEAGPFRLYHAGDTVPYGGQAQRVGAVDVALLPINGRPAAQGIAGNLDGDEAAELAAALPARLAVPCHFEMFAFNTALPSRFVAACERLGVAGRVLRAGERLTLTFTSS
jgi:L-ascorbate metabolism protein UlaG (beta-lactamase superfamily)